MFINSDRKGLNSVFIRGVLISNPLLVYIDLMVSIGLTSCFRVLLLMHSMVVKFMLRLIFMNKGIVFTNKMSLLILMLFLDFITPLGTVI